MPVRNTSVPMNAMSDENGRRLWSRAITLLAKHRQQAQIQEGLALRERVREVPLQRQGFTRKGFGEQRRHRIIGALERRVYDKQINHRAGRAWLHRLEYS